MPVSADLDRKCRAKTARERSGKTRFSRMDKDDYLTALELESQAFIEAVLTNLDGVVAHCGDWSVHDLGVHLGTMWQIATANVLAASHAPSKPSHPFHKNADEVDLSEFLLGSQERMLDALRAADPEAPAWSFAPNNHTAGFWQRRMAHETAMHRWDAEKATGTPKAITTELASDGIDEFTVVGLRHSSSKPNRNYPAQSLHLHCTDVDGEWTLVGSGGPSVSVTREHAKGDAAVRGPASDLLLWIWGRPGGDVDIFGDAEVATIWRSLAP
jgi:uncharacterized protein (TIGR03083 family)